MIYEIAEIQIIPGNEAAFIAAVEEARPLFLAAKGCHGMALKRSIETPTYFRLLVKWETVEDHMDGFRNSGAFAEWRRLASPHFASPPHVEHLAVVVEG